MDSSYNILNHDCAPIDRLIGSSSDIISNNNNLSKDGAYDNFNVMLSASTCSMNMKSAIELELFRRLDGGSTATSSSSSSSSMAHQANSFNIIPPFIHQQAHYPSSLSHTSPLAQILLSTSHIKPSPATTSPIKRGRDSNTLTDAFKEEEDNREEEEMKGKKVWKKVKSRVKREEEINYMEQRSCKPIGRGEEEEERGQKKEEKEKTNRRGGGVGGSGHSKASSIHTSKSTKNGTSKKEARPPPPPPAPKSDFIHVRARRGQATDSHSLAERVRREKISERMRFLQDLVPGCTKITGKAMMLDEIINYVQSLQHQVEFLAMKVADLHPKQIAINFDDSFMEEEIASALAEVQGTCLDVGIQAMESQCPTYYTQMHDLSTIFNMRFCDDEDVPFISDVSTDVICNNHLQ